MSVRGGRLFKGSVKVILLFSVLLASLRPAAGQKMPERFWLAGRYDGNRVIVYFDAVKFEGTMAPLARKIAPPTVDSFFEPDELPASYIEQFQKDQTREKFKLGDRYDLLLGNGSVETIKLTTLIGCETDEGVGNDSYIGALGTVEHDTLFLTKGYYVVRRHQETWPSGVKPNVQTVGDPLKPAYLFDGPVQLDLEAQIAGLLTQQMKLYAKDSQKAAIQDTPPAMLVQEFRIADGSLRYYAQAVWRSGTDPMEVPGYLIAAWLAPLPKLHILAVEKPRKSVDVGPGYVPKLLNVVDLGSGRTAVILDLLYGETTELKLAEYRDGAAAADMPVLQSISAGE